MPSAAPRAAISSTASRDGEVVAEVLGERAIGVLLVRDADDHQHEARILRLLAQPDDAHAAVGAVVHDVQADVAPVELDALRDVARARGDVREMRPASSSLPGRERGDGEYQHRQRRRVQRRRHLVQARERRLVRLRRACAAGAAAAPACPTSVQSSDTATGNARRTRSPNGSSGVVGASDTAASAVSPHSRPIM